jgi:acyl carrier protein
MSDVRHTKNDVVSAVKDILLNYERVDMSKFHERAVFDDIGLDSLDGQEALGELEEKFNIEVPDYEASTIFSVDCAVEAVMKRLSKKPSLI